MKKYIEYGFLPEGDRRTEDHSPWNVPGHVILELLLMHKL